MENKHFLPPNMHVSGGKKCSFFSENLACFVFLLPPFLDSAFCRITDELIRAQKKVCRIKSVSYKGVGSNSENVSRV